MNAVPRRAFLSAVGLGLSGCSSGPPPPAVLDLAVTGGVDQNPDQADRPAPVVVRLYQLASASKFEQADVFALLEHEAETLGSDLLGSEALVLAPSEKREVKHELRKGAQVLGVAVLFRDIDGAKWRTVAPVAPSGPTRLTLAVGKLSVTLGPAKP